MAWRQIPDSILASVLQHQTGKRAILCNMTQPIKNPLHYYLAGYVVLLLMCPVNALQANIHQCVSSEGIEYSDTHCTMGTLVKHSPGLKTIGTIEGLSRPELENLEKLDQAYRKARLESDQQRSARKKRLLRERALNRRNRARSCASAIKGLERIRLIKRKGYSAKQSRALDTRQNLLHAQKHSNC